MNRISCESCKSCLTMIPIPMLQRAITVSLVSLVIATTPLAQKGLIHQPIIVTITQAEDERRWSDDLMRLLSNPSPVVRKRAALAAGRIGRSEEHTSELQSPYVISYA